MPKEHEIEAEANDSSLSPTLAHKKVKYRSQRCDTKPTPEKYCVFCGCKMERKQYQSKREDLGAFMRRKYCSWICMRKAFVRKDSTNQDWKSAHATARKIVHLIEHRPVVCAHCGSTQNVDIHHIDGIAQNNSSENLILLCRSCHMKQHRKAHKVCKICGKICERTQRGMCNKHYLQWKRNGDPLHKPWSTFKEKKSKGPIEVFDRYGNLVKIYQDVRTAAKESGYARSSVASACNGGIKTLGGLIWKYATR